MFSSRTPHSLSGHCGCVSDGYLKCTAYIRYHKNTKFSTTHLAHFVLGLEVKLFLNDDTTSLQIW